MQQDLSSVLSEFAHTMLTDFPIQSILDTFVQRVVELLPVTGAGVTLIAPGEAPRYVAASDPAALRFEQLQAELGQGPCMTAYESGHAVAVPDLRDEARFPLFAHGALEAGLAAVFTFPLRHGAGRLGALDLYRGTPGPLGDAELRTAQVLADVASAYLLNAQAREDALAVSEQFRDRAVHDALTGLPNRALLEQRLEHAAQRASRSHTAAAVLFADLDRFKRVNDTYGHAVGDLLLVAVAHRLSALLRPGDTLARVSGDEFVVLCEDLASPSDVEALARRVDGAFAEPFELGDLTLLTSASVGVAYCGPGEDVTYQLVVDADSAMYEAKRRGRAAHVLDLRRGAAPAPEQGLARDLRAALAADGLALAYQPVVATGDGRVVGVEALLRWDHPVRGPVPAERAVEAAEATGFVVELGRWVLERACAARASWLAEHPDRPLDLWVNVSVLEVLDAGFGAGLGAALARTRTDPRALVLEVTEGTFIEDRARAAAVLGEVRGRGVRVALDDFGTGWSSLDLLRTLPVDAVKVDRGFVTDLGRVPAAGAVLVAVAGLAATLGLVAVAEGVETPLQQAQLAAMGCGLAQGHLYAPAMSEAAVGALLSARPSSVLQLPRSLPATA